MNIETLVNKKIKDKKAEIDKKSNDKILDCQLLLRKMYPNLMDSLNCSFNIEWFIGLNNSLLDGFLSTQLSFLDYYTFDFYLCIINKKLDSYVIVLVKDHYILLIDKFERKKVTFQKLNTKNFSDKIYEPTESIDEDTLIIEIGNILFNYTIHSVDTTKEEIIKFIKSKNILLI
mgnify:CR=1 FL=1